MTAPWPFLVVVAIIQVVSWVNVVRTAKRISQHPAPTMSFGPLVLPKRTWLALLIAGNLLGSAFLWIVILRIWPWT